MSNSRLTGIKDLDIEILSKLDYFDLINTCMTNKNIAKICRDQLLWKIKFQKDFNSTSIPDKTQNWRQLYQKFYVKKNFIDNIMTIMANSYTEKTFRYIWIGEGSDVYFEDTLIYPYDSYSEFMSGASERLERESVSVLCWINSLSELIKHGGVSIMEKSTLRMEKAPILVINNSKFCVMSSYTGNNIYPPGPSPLSWPIKPGSHKENKRNKVKLLLDFILLHYDRNDIEKDLDVEGPVHDLGLDNLNQFREYERSELMSLPIEILNALHHIQLLIISKYIYIDPIYVPKGEICSGFLLYRGNLVLFCEQ